MTPRVRRYVRLSAAVYGTTAKKVRGDCRDALNVRARHAVMRRLHEDGFSFAQIGRWMNRDHTTVLHAVRKARAA